MIFLQTTLFPSAALAQVVAGFSSVQISGAMPTIILQPAPRQDALHWLVAGRTPSRFSGMDIGGIGIKEAGLRQTVAQTAINRAAKTLTQTVNVPDSDTDDVTTTVNGLLASQQTKSGVVTTYSYDALERQTGVTDPRTGTSVTHYNTLGQVDHVEDAAHNRTSFTYDATSGRKATETNALGKVTRFGYDAQGRVTQVWGDAPYPVRYTFDTYGRLHLMDTWRQGTGWNAATFPTNMEASKDTTTWNYQEATGLLTSKQDAAGRSVSYTYTTGGKLLTRAWARNSGTLTTTYSYDANTGELLNINYSDTTPDVTFTYDRLGRQATVTDAVGSRSFVYFADVRPYQETVTGLYDRVIEHDYTTLGIIGLPSELTTGSNYSVTYGYQPDTGRPLTVSWNVGGAGSRTATYAYVANSDLISSKTIGNQTTSYTYEPARDLKTQVRNQYNGTTVSQYDYVSDAIGRRTSVANTGTAFSAAAFNRFTYDNRSELAESARYLGTDINILTNPVPSEYRHFDYDPIGNRTNITIASNSGTYAANNLNQYTAATLPANTFTNDFDGNLTAVSGAKNVTYTYDAENRLITAAPTTPAVNDKRLTFTYDYQGRRVQKIIANWTGSAWSTQTTKQFVYDGWNMIEEITTGTGAGIRYFIYGLDLSQSLQGAGGIGGLLAKVESGTTHLYQYDGNGNVGQLVNVSTGAIDAQYEYDAYGNSIVASGTQAAVNPFRFSTKYIDTESGLYYYGYRYYDPETGRWLSLDPLEELGFALMSANIELTGEAGQNSYAFSANRPIDYYDVYGLFFTPETGWDAFNVGAGVISFGCNIASGNVVGALVDGAGLTYDAIATEIPGLPGGAHTLIELYRGSRLAKNMVRFLEANQTAMNVYRYGVRKGVDAAHHIVALTAKKAEPARRVLRRLKIDINDASNGVALPAKFVEEIEKAHVNIHTDEYFKMVNEVSQNWHSREEAIRGLGEIAEKLLKELGKIK